MDGLPDALFVIDPKKEYIAIQEAKKLGIPVVPSSTRIAIRKTSNYVIPGNDDAIRAIRLVHAEDRRRRARGYNLADEKFIGVEDKGEPEAAAPVHPEPAEAMSAPAAS